MKNIKLIAMALILVIVIGFGIYLTTGNEKEVSEGEASSKEVAQVAEDEGKQVTDVNMVTQFYYSEVSKESLLDFWGGRKLFYRHENGFVKAVKEADKLTFVTLEKGEKIGELNIGDFHLNAMDISPDGFLWTIPVLEETPYLSLEKRDLKGTVIESIKINEVQKLLEAYPTIYVDQLRVQSDHIYIRANGSLWVFDKSGALKYEHPFVDTFDVDHNGDYVINASGNKNLTLVGCVKYSIVEGKEIFRLSTQNIEVLRFSEDYSKLVLGSHDGKIRVINPENGFSEMTIFEYGLDSSFLKDDLEHMDLVFTVGGNLEVVMTNWNNPEGYQFAEPTLYRFKRLEGTRTKKEPTLVFTAPYRSDFMLEAIKRYELKYPEEHIKYDYDFNTYEDFVNNSTEYGQKLILKIINNEIGDVVQTGGSKLNYWPLAQKDVFMDLDERLKALPYYDDLNHKVLEANRIGGKIRALPTFYNFFQYELNESLADKAGIKSTGDVKWSDVLTWIPKLQAADPSATLFNDRPNDEALEHMLFTILVANMPDLIDIEDKTVNLNQKWFKDLMIQYKGIATYENISNDTQAYDLGERTQNSLLARWTPVEYLSDNINWYSRSLEKKPSKMIPSFVGEKNNNRIAYSSYMYSINQRTEKPEKAWQFLSFLISEEIQNTKGRDGAPLNLKSVAHRFTTINNPIILENPKIQEDWVKPYYENIEKIDFLNDMGNMKTDLSDEIKRFVNDQITLDEALKNAEQKIMIRLNE